MINVSVHYPRREGARFDMEYYRAKHIPLLQERYGPTLKGLTVLEAVAGGLGGERSPNVASAHLVFESVEAFTAALGPHVEEIMADVANYTDITPVLEISEIR